MVDLKKSSVGYHMLYELFCPLPATKFTNLFFRRFPRLPAEVIVLDGEIILTGDFKLPLDHPEQTTAYFLDLLSSFDLIQLVDFDTHIDGHWLDLVIICGESDLVGKLLRSDRLSDHFAIMGLRCGKPSSPHSSHSYFHRNIKAIDEPPFKSDLLHSSFIINPANTVTSLSKQFQFVYCPTQ